MSDLINKRAFLKMMGTVAVAAPTAAITARAMTDAAHSAPHDKRETAFDRVIRTNTLRCGYGIWEPGLSKDLLTGKLKGIFFEYLEAIGRHTGLNITWTEEIAWGDYPTALNSGRIDAMCFGAWPKANIAREVLFTEPTYYLPIKAYVREGDKRFDHKLDKINSPSVIISTMDSELSSELAHTRFPHAKTFSVPQLSDASTLLLNVATGKADITFTDAWTGAAFMVKNAGKIREVPTERPLRLFGHTIPVAKGEHSLVALLNAATDEIMSSGEFEAIVRRYETMPGVLLLERENYN